MVLMIVSIPVLAQLQTDSARANIFMRQAHGMFNRGEYDSAYQTFIKARLLIEPYGEELPALLGRMLFHEGEALQYQWKDEEALKIYLVSQEYLDQNTPYLDSTRADLYNNVGGIYINLGFRSKAKPYLEQALDIRQQLDGPDAIGVAVTSYNLGLLNLYQGESFSALQHFMRALPAYLNKYGEYGARVAQLYTNVGLLHRDIGELDVAEEYFNRGVEIHLHNHGPDYWNLAYPYTSLGGVYMDRKDYATALNYYLMAQEICRANSERLVRVEAIVAAALANTYREMGDYSAAHESVDEAMVIFSKNYHDDHPRYADYYRIKGNIYLAQDMPDDAAAWYEKSIENTRNAYGEKHPNLAAAYERLAWVNLEEEQFNNALKYIQLGYISLSDNYDPQVLTDYPDQAAIAEKKHLIRMLNLHARILRDRSGEAVDLSSGIEILRNASNAIDVLRQGYLTEESKIFIQGNALTTYEGAVFNLARLYELTGNQDYLLDAFRYFEKSKSTVLAEAIQSSSLYIPSGIDSSIAVVEQSVNNEIRDLEIKLSQEQNDSIQREIRESLFVSRRKADSISVVLKTNWPDYYDLKYCSDVLEAEEVMAGLPEGAALLTYLEGDSTWYILTITAETIHFVEEGGLDEKRLGSFTEMIRDPGSDPASFIPLGREIYESLVAKPLEGLIVESLIIIPDGELYYLPFDALSTSGNVNNPDYLISSYALQYLNSATLQAAANTQGSYAQNYLGFAPEYAAVNQVKSGQSLRDELGPLEGNIDEVNYGGVVFNGNVYTGLDATKESFSDNQISARILHLAMHATADDDEPMNSGLWFTNDSESNGYLNATEIYGLDIESQLVVLSACNTGAGTVRRGEGVMSLSRAFMYAGCPNIVMSLWRASDQPSSVIMKAFFDNLDASMPKGEALQQAKLAYLSVADPLQAHPAYWASFVLVGDNDPIRNGSQVWVILSFSLILIFIVGGILIRNKRKV